MIFKPEIIQDFKKLKCHLEAHHKNYFCCKKYQYNRMKIALQPFKSMVKMIVSHLISYFNFF